MHAPLPTIYLAPYEELKQLGYGIDLKTTEGGKFKLHLLRNTARVLTAICPRSANLSIEEALQRTKDNLWGDTAQMTLAMNEFVEFARAYPNKNVMEGV